MPKPIYALVGSDSFLQLQRLAAILREMPADVQRIDIDGEQADLAEVLDELRSFAMFGGSKIVIMRNADDFLTRFREPLENYAAAPVSSATLVLRLSSLPKNQRIYKAIAKVGRVEACDPPPDRDLPRWIIERGKSVHKISLAADAAAMLADMIGNDLGRLDNELAKIAIHCEGEKVEAKNLAGTVCFQREQEMWDMTNQLAWGRPDEAIRRWRQLIQLDPSTEFRAVTWLGMWLENVRKALAMKRQGMQPFAISQQLRIWPREMQGPFMKTAEKLGDRGVARATDLLAEIDLQSKSGIGNAAGNVERFLLSISL